MTDVKEKLLKSTGPYQELCLDVESRIMKLSSQNDVLQRNCDIDSDKQQFYRQLRLQKNDIDIFISELKSSLVQIERQSKGIDGKNKCKRLKDLFTKQLERNKSIFENYLLRSSFGTQESDQNQNNENENNQQEFIQQQQGDKDRQEFYPVLIQNEKQEKFIRVVNSDIEHSKQIQYLRESEDVEKNMSQYIIDNENIMIQQNQEDLDQIQQEVYEINKCMKNIAQEVQVQDQFLDIIQDNFIQTKEKVQQTDDQLNKANENNKSSTKWYLILLIVIVLIIILILVLIFFIF